MLSNFERLARERSRLTNQLAANREAIGADMERSPTFLHGHNPLSALKKRRR